MSRERLDAMRELAQKIWPLGLAAEDDEDLDPIEVTHGHGELRIANAFEEDSTGLLVKHPERALEAAEAALRVLAGGDEFAQLRARVAELEAELLAAHARGRAEGQALERAAAVAWLKDGSQHPVVGGHAKALGSRMSRGEHLTDPPPSRNETGLRKLRELADAAGPLPCSMLVVGDPLPSPWSRERPSEAGPWWWRRGPGMGEVLLRVDDDGVAWRISDGMHYGTTAELHGEWARATPPR